VDRSYAPNCSPIPENDSCENAVSLGESNIAVFKTTGASTDGVPVVPQGFAPDLINYFPLGDRQVHKDIWYALYANCPGTIAVDVCHADFDAKTALYPYVECLSDSPIAIDDDTCGPDLGLQSRLTAFLPAQNYFPYWLRIGGYRGDFGSGEVTWNYAPPESSDLRTFAAFTASGYPAPSGLGPSLSRLAASHRTDVTQWNKISPLSQLGRCWP
jgi:hypothetical protein